MTDRYVAKSKKNSIYYGVLDCAKDEWYTEDHKNRYGRNESTVALFIHKEAAEYKAAKLNEARSDG